MRSYRVLNQFYRILKNENFKMEVFANEMSFIKEL